MISKKKMSCGEFNLLRGRFNNLRVDLSNDLNGREEGIEVSIV